LADISDKMSLILSYALVAVHKMGEAGTWFVPTWKLTGEESF
jgi:hypothetical protein